MKWRKTMYLSIARKIGIMALMLPLVATSASAYTTAEYAAHKKGCEGQGGTVGIYQDGRLGCHMGANSNMPAGFKVIKSKKEFEAASKGAKVNLKKAGKPAASVSTATGAGKANVQDLQ